MRSGLLCAVFGLACHIGVQLDLPSVGVAKTLHHVDGIEKNEEYQQKVALEPYSSAEVIDIIILIIFIYSRTLLL